MNIQNGNSAYVILRLMFFLFFGLSATAQVAICGWDGSGTSDGAGDEFSFVLLRDYAAGEVIYFTEGEYTQFGGSFDSSEGHIAYTVPVGGLLDNEVVKIVDTGNDVFDVQCAGGSAVKVPGSGNWSFSNADEIYAYSATNPAAPWSSIEEIYCFVWGSNIIPPSDQVPTNDYPNAIVVTFNIGGGAGVNADFLDASRNSTTVSVFQDGSNWLQSTTDITLSCTDFTTQMLPIELVSFEGALKGREVILEWVTASELNNEKFEIEHSLDGKTFTIIGTIAGQGTSDVTTHYSMVHPTPAGGINYYRMKQVDFDGNFEYSEIINVKNNTRNSISFSPNPFSTKILISADDQEIKWIEGSSIILYDGQGQIVLKKQITANNIYEPINTEYLNAGMYFMSYDNGSVVRLVKY